MPFDPALLMLGVLLVLMFMVFRRGSRQRQELAQVQHDLAPGAEVMMASGLYATVTAVEDDVVTVQTGPGQHSRWDRRAVARIITPRPADETADEAAAEAADQTHEGGAPAADTDPA